MKTLTINNKLLITFQDSFTVLSAEERQKLNTIEQGPYECLSDQDRHILISIGFRPLGGLFSIFLSTKDAAHNSESKISQAMQSYGFKLIEHKHISLCNNDAKGFSYEYIAQGTSMYGESYVLKHDKALYYLNYYSRHELLTDNQKIWDEILSLAKWVD